MASFTKDVELKTHIPNPEALKRTEYYLVFSLCSVGSTLMLKVDVMSQVCKFGCQIGDRSLVVSDVAREITRENDQPLTPLYIYIYYFESRIDKNCTRMYTNVRYLST